VLHVSRVLTLAAHPHGVELKLAKVYLLNCLETIFQNTHRLIGSRYMVLEVIRHFFRQRCGLIVELWHPVVNLQRK